MPAENLLDVHFWHWGLFLLGIGFLLFLDLLVFHRHDHTPSLQESFLWSVFWVGLALVFNAFVWWWGWHLHGNSEAGVKFLTGFVVEKSLSVDNLFVFAVIFRYFGVHIKYQHRILFWGIVGAIVMRFIFVIAGVKLLQMFEWILLIFGGFLIYTGIHLAFAKKENVDPERNIVLRFARRWFRITREPIFNHFLVRKDGLLYATPGLLVLLVVESTDVVFAVDSVPAVIGITRDPFIVFSSNIWAILGLRALYFLLAGVLDRFEYLHYGLAAVLSFIGFKMVGEYLGHQYFGLHGRLINPWVSLLIITTILTMSLIPTLLGFTPKKALSENDEQNKQQKLPGEEGFVASGASQADS